MTAWTKEQLKSLARVSSTGKKEVIVDDLPTEDVSKLKRKINKRAVPKVAFSALLLAPALGFTYMLASNNFVNDQGEVKAAEPDPQTKQLLEKLDASNERIEELEAQLAVMKQEQSRPVAEVVEEAPPPEPEVKKAVPKPAAKPPPPRKRVVRRTPPPVTSTQKRVRVQQPPPPPVVASVFGAGSRNDFQENTPSQTDLVASRPLRKEDRQFVQVVDSSYDGSGLTVANNYPRIDPELEASLLQEQPMMVLKTGTTAKANLAVPWVRDFQSREAGDKVISVVLTEPLRAAGRRIFLPAQTTILVRAESLGQPDIIEFVGVEAHLPTDSGGNSTKIELPEGIIRFSADNGQPLIALPLRDKSNKSQGRSIFDLLDSAEQVWEVGERITSNDDLVEGVLREQRRVRYELGRRGRGSQRRYSDRSIVFLSEGTKLKLYVNQEVTVPGISY